MADSPAPAKPKAQVDLERIAAADPRIEYVARALCIARGLNPDHMGFPYPPSEALWEAFILEARDFLAESDAARRSQKLKPGPPD